MLHSKESMHKTELSTPSISYILKKISDDKALTLFNNIALAKDNSHIPLKEMNLSTKQYYSRISGLTSAGLIKKKQGRYFLTALGKVVYNAHTVIGKALSYYWKMKAIESIQSSAGRELAREDMLMLIQSLIDNHQVRDILLKSIPSVEAFEMRR
ncbi:MAG: hypothetical protein M3146_02340 [Thermoproteota archaeon]|nr:hypothetical protein [Thermoproteota archaeon]